ncbi:hypothetical protein BHM03_00001053 [Ensete ventricosum]|nr:hypothetical protein BHM03_00001053 [Ensete ventricosum]
MSCRYYSSSRYRLVVSNICGCYIWRLDQANILNKQRTAGLGPCALARPQSSRRRVGARVGEKGPESGLRGRLLE